MTEQSDAQLQTANPHLPTACPKCFDEAQSDGASWWLARPEGSRLVGLVVARDGLPSIVQQREDLSRFGVEIEAFRHPAPDVLESWSDRLARFVDTLKSGDVLVVTSTKALGVDRDEELRTIGELRQRGIIVKVLEHGQRHLS